MPFAPSPPRLPWLALGALLLLLPAAARGRPAGVSALPPHLARLAAAAPRGARPNDAQDLPLNNATTVDYKHGWNFYKVSVPDESGDRHVLVQVEGLVEEPHGNLDVFVKLGAPPDFGDFDYVDSGCQRDYKTFAGVLITGGNYHEACTGTKGDYYIGLYSQVLIKGQAKVWPRIV